jgi:hypothetical protein
MVLARAPRASSRRSDRRRSFRGSRDAPLVTALTSAGLLSPGPQLACQPPHASAVAPPSASAPYSRSPTLEVATSSSGFGLPSASPTGVQVVNPGAGDAIPPRQRPVLAVSHDLDGVTAHGPTFLAALRRPWVAASPRPPIGAGALPAPRICTGGLASPSNPALQGSGTLARRPEYPLLLPIMGFIEFQAFLVWARPPPGVGSLPSLSIPSMHSCPSEPSLPAVAATHPRCHPTAGRTPVSRVPPSRPLAPRFTPLHAPLAVGSTLWLLLPRSSLHGCVAGASRPASSRLLRSGALAPVRTSRIGLASPRCRRISSTSGYFRR